MEKVLKVYLLGSSASTPFPSESEQIVVTDFDYNAPRMGIPSIHANVKHRLCLDNLWSDKVYVEFNGEKYFTRNTPSSKKSNDDTRYGHEINFTSERDKLNHVYFIDAVQDDSDTDAYKSNSTKVMFFGNLSQFVERLNSSLEYSNTGYTAVVDSGITTEDKQVSFEDQYVMQSLQTAFETFEIPYYFVGKVIHFGYTPNALTEVFKYGDKNSLISISKENANYQIVNRITGRGSTDNIPLYYPNKSPKGDISAVVQSAGGITTSNVTITDYEKFAKMDATKSLQYTPSTAQYVSGRYVRKENGSVVTDVDGLANPMNITLELNKKLDEIPMEFDNVYELTSGTSIVFDIELLREGAPISLSLYLKKAVAINSRGEEVSTGKMVSSSTGTDVVFDNLSENGQYTFRYYFTFSRNYTKTVKIRFGTAPKATAYWMYDGEVVELSDFGLRVNGTPAAGDKIVLNVGHYIPTSTNLLPSIYRESEGAKRFIDAKNDTYEDENGGYYEFENEYSPNNPLEGIQDFDDIKPSITGITNAAGQPIDKFLEFAYDLNDNDEVDDEGNYLHPYFFAKLPKTDGTYGFNLFDQAIESQAMQISFTSGICGACTFEIGVGEETQKNLVQVAPSGALLRDEDGNVLWENQSPQDEQNDTRIREVWIALKKDNTTYPQMMPNANFNYKPSTDDTFVILGIKLPEAYILAAEKRLDDALIKYMWENNVEKFTFSASFSRIYFEEHPEVLEQLNENARVTIEYNGRQHTLYVNEYTYKMSSSSPLPEISISLVDVISVGSNTLQSTVESIAQGLISGITTNNDFVRQGIRYFLRKDVQDTARGKITFLQGIDVGTYAENSGGGTMRILEDLSSYVEVDRLRVRVKAYFETLEIINTNSVGGKMILTAGGGVYLREVVEENDHYRCFFLTTQDGRTIENRFKVGDLAISQSFNVEAGVHQGISNHYYWREVVGVGSDYVDLSKSICDTGSDVPMAEDTLVHLGNRTDAERQGAIIFSAVDVFSPSIILYHGINDFSLTDKDYVAYGIDKTTNKAFFRVYGDFYAGNREQTAYVKYSPETGMEMRGKFVNEGGESISDILDRVQDQIDGNIETWFYEPAPTLTNEPAVNWATESDKINHLGDLYYSGEGKAYRFQKEGDNYVWKLLQDSDITKALADAAKAQEDAAAAQEEAEAASGRLDQWASDGFISPTEKSAIKDEIVRIDSDHSEINANYAKYGLGTPSSYNTAYTNYRNQLTALSADTPENITIPDNFRTNQTTYYNLRTEALDAISDASRKEVSDVADIVGQIQEDVNGVKESVTQMGNTVNGMRDFTDEAFKDGIVDRSESSAIASYLQSIETFAKDVAESYAKVYGNSLLTGTPKTTLNIAYKAFNTAKDELVSTINGAIADGRVDNTEKAGVDGKYAAFNTKYGDFIAAINAANKAIQDVINQNALNALRQIGEYSYLKAALKELTTIEGGLIQSSTLALGYTDDDEGYKVMAGTNGIYDDTKLGGGIASWWGGAMFDRFEYTEETMPENVASALVRMDGTGYFAKGNLWWESDGTLHADPLSFFVGEDSVGDVLGLFQFVKSDAGIEYVIPQYPFQKLEIGNYLQIGKAQLYWDEANQAFYVRHQDGVSPVGFYATGFISTKGANPNAGGVVSGASKLTELEDVSVSSVANGQVLSWDATSKRWVNKTVEAGLDTAELEVYLTSHNYAKKSDIPALTDYATQEWVNSKLGSYATTSAMNSALGNKVDKVAGKGLSSNDFTDALLTKLNGIEEGANKYVLPTATGSVLGGVKVGATLAIALGVLNMKAVGTAGTYTKVTVDAYGRVTGHSSLAATDIPNLPWSKITSGKPTTLSGYGITDGANSVTVAGTGNAVTAASISGHVLTLTKGTTFLVKSTFDDLFEKVALDGGGYAIRAKYALYSESWISAKGQNPDAGGSVAGATNLDDLSDVTISSPANGQVLQYNGSKWVNVTLDIEPGLDEGALASYLVSNGYTTQAWVTGQKYLKSVSLSTISDLHANWDALLKAAPGAYVTRWPSWGEVTSKPTIFATNIANIGDLHASWDVLLKAAPSAYVTRWPAWGEVTGKPSTFAPSAHTHPLSQVSDLHASWDALLKTAPSVYVTRWPAFSEVTGKPTTLGGYGITDGVNAVSVTGSGNAVTTASISGHTLTLTKGSTFLLSSSYTAADILAKLKTVDGSGSGLDADLLDGVQASGFLQYAELGRYEDYVYTVVGLCQITDYTQVGNWSKGEILAQRNNGIYDGSVIKYYIQTRYNSTNSGAAVYFNYSCWGNVGNIRPCTFTYKGKKYAGVVFNSQTASIDKYRISGHKSFHTQPFFVAYLYKKGDTTTVRNAEINSSIVVKGSDLSLSESVFTAPVLSATSSVKIGGGTISWDAATGAFHFSHGIYSDRWISAKGANSSAGGTVSPVATKLNDLTDVTISSPANGQVLQYNGSQWVNKALPAGLDESALASYLVSNGYLTSTSANAAYVKKAGDTMAGKLRISSADYGNQLDIYRNTNTGNAVINYYNTTGLLGRIGVCGSAGTYPGQPMFANASGTNYALLHSGNYTTYTVTNTGSGASGIWPISLQVKDIRGTTPTPNDKGDRSAEFWFNNQAKPGSSAWYSGLTVKGWLDGYTAWQVSSGSSSANDDSNLYFRSGINTSWSSWKKLLDSSNYSDTLDGRYVTLSTAQTISGTKTFSNSIRLEAKGFLIRNTASGGNATSISWVDTNWSIIGSVGGYTSNRTSDFKTYMGWGSSPWTTANNFEVSSTFIRYKGNDILHTGNYSSTLDSRYVNVSGDRMTGTLTICTTGTNSYNQGIRINRTALSNWATLTIGYVGTGTSGASANTWLIGTPSNSNSLIFNLNGSSASAGLCLKGTGTNDIVWNNQKVWHAGNDGPGSGLDADLLDGTQKSALLSSVASSATTNLSVAVGGTTKSVADLYATYLEGVTLSGIRQLGYAMQKTTIDASSLDANTWYPVTIDIGANHQVLIAVVVSLDSGTKPSWSTHTNGFSVRKVWYANGSGWGTNKINRIILFSDYGFASSDPVRGLDQLSYSSSEYVRVRGGGKYHFYTSHGKKPVLRTSTYTINEQSVSPTTTAPAVISRTNALVTDNVASATKLKTARTLWGQSFDGTANVSGNMTGVGSITMSGTLSTAGAATISGLASFLGASAVGCSGYNVGARITHASHASLEVASGNYVMGLGCHSNGSWHWWKGASGYGSSANKSYVMSYGINSNTWSFTGIVSASTRLESNTVKIGSGTITWDSSTGAFHFSHGLYSDSFISAKGANSGAGGSVVAGATKLSALDDVSLGTLAANQVLTWNGSKWTNKAFTAGMDEAQLASYLVANGYLTQANANNSYAYKTGTNASGTWGISISGNAASATKLQTARTISLTGNVTGSASFNGTANVSINASCNYAANADKLDNLHASSFLQNFTAGNFDYNTKTTSGVYRLNYATSNGSTNGPSGYEWSQMLVMHGGGDTIAQMVIGYSNHLVTYRSGNPSNVGGSGSWSSWYTLARTIDNVASASKLHTARTITLTGAVTGSVSFDGSKNVSLATTYAFTNLDSRYVNVSGDTMTGTLTICTTGTNSYNQGIRINRTALSNWATLTIGYVGTGTSGASANTWLIGTPSNSNSLIFNLNGSSASAGLCLKGTGTNDIVWNNQKVWHAGNDGPGSGLDADLLDGYQGSFYRECQGKNNRVDITVGGDANTYYPVVIGATSTYYPATLLNITRTYSETAPNSWNTSTHKGGLTLCMLYNSSKFWDGNGNGSASVCNVIQFEETYSTMVGGIGSSTSGLVVWLRGGTAAYHVFSNAGVSLSVTVHTSSFTDDASQTFAPKTARSSIAGYQSLGVNASSASHLATSRTINGTAFNGSANIVTSYWGTARNFYIRDHDSSHTGAAVSVNGSANEYLLLPSTITATLNGNATSASYWQTARTLTVSGDATGSVSIRGNANMSLSLDVKYATSAGNADTVDSLHASAFARKDQNPAVDLNTVNGNGIMTNPANANATTARHYPIQEAGTLFYGAAAYNSANQIYGTFSSNRWFFRGGGGSTTTKTAWKEMAFLTSNVASATKLQNSRTIWGQSFNGTANVSGALSGATTISASSNITTTGGYFYCSVGWFQNSKSGCGLYNSVNDARWYANSSGWISDKKINANAGLGVSGTTTLGGAVQVPYTAGSWISMATRTNLIYSTANNSQSNAHALFRVKAYNGNAICFGGLGNNVGFYAFTAANISSGTNAQWHNTNWDMTNWKLTHGGALAVSGAVTFSSTLAVTGAITGSSTVYAKTGVYSDGYVSAKGQNTSSDLRLKDVLSSVRPSLEAFAKAPLFRFAWKSDPGMVEIGSSAQYWRNVLPDTVKERDGWLEMGYGNIALAGVITIARDFETLEQRVDRLEKENGKLKKRIKELERRAA